MTRYSPQESQGRALALNQAAQACARIISPILAGLLYEYSKKKTSWCYRIGLPAGSLPFLLGALFPAAAVSIPYILLAWNRSNKVKRGKSAGHIKSDGYDDDGSGGGGDAESSRGFLEQ